ncbi:hypothetical protein RYX36_008106 [Vicia faba]
MEIEIDDTVPPPAKGSAVPSESDPYILSFSFDRPTYDGVIIGRVSGRNWKQTYLRWSDYRESLRQELEAGAVEEVVGNAG